MEFENKYPCDIEKRQNEIPNKHTMGNKTEIALLPKYKRLSELDSWGSFSETRQGDYYREASAILADLNLSLNLRALVLKNAESFYSLLGKGTYHRGAKKLIPVSIYITTLESFVFVKRSAFYQYCPKHDFDRCLKVILRKNALLRFKLHSDDFRLRTILVQLKGLKARFYFNGAFSERLSENLHKYYDSLRNSINASISAVIFDLTAHQLMGKFILLSEVCRFLGISQSSIFRRRLY